MRVFREDTRPTRVKGRGQNATRHISSPHVHTFIIRSTGYPTSSSVIHLLLLQDDDDDDDDEKKNRVINQSLRVTTKSPNMARKLFPASGSSLSNFITRSCIRARTRAPLCTGAGVQSDFGDARLDDETRMMRQGGGFTVVVVSSLLSG